MLLFPLGELTGGLGTGKIDDVVYNFFEPNKKARSSVTHTTLISQFETMTILTRKKAQPFLNITYEYRNVFQSEFNQIEHFIISIGDANTSFFIIDLSQGQVPSVINTSSTWVASIPNTRLYSNVTNLKANYIFFYNGSIWKLGTISSISANTSVTTDVDTNNYGTMTDAQGAIVTGNSKVFIYPVYQCYLNPNSLDSFKVTNRWDNNDSDRGFMYSGTISAVSKYKVG